MAPTIKREDLVPVLRKAYDKAAKGIENDDSRTNEKNDETKIDSENELCLFKSEVDKLMSGGNLDQCTYDSVNEKINTVFNQIKSIRSVRQKYLQIEADRLNYHYNHHEEDEAKAKLEQYEKKHPIKSFFAKLADGFGIDTYYGQLSSKAYPNFQVCENVFTIDNVKLPEYVDEKLKYDEKKKISELW